MYSLKSLHVFLILAIFTTTMGIASSGELRAVDEPGVVKKGVDGILPVISINAVPAWPMDYGPIDNSRRARVSGPGPNMRETASVDLFDSGLIWESLQSAYIDDHTLKPFDREDAFSRLLVGPGNQLYFSMLLPEHKAIFAYKIALGKIWQTMYSSTESALDNQGNMFRTSGSIHIVNYFGESDLLVTTTDYIWNGSGFGSYYYAYKGNQYFGTYGAADLQLKAFNAQGQEAWVNGPILSLIEGFAEDSNGFIYVRDRREGLRKISPTGETVWDIKMPAEKYTTKDGKKMLGPILGPDGRIWASTKLWSNEETVIAPGTTPGSSKKSTEPRNGPVYMVINADGSVYKYGKYANGSIPRIACMGNNGVLYLAFEDGTVAGYQDWDELVGEWQVPAENGIHDMIMDKDNWIYVAYTAYGLQDLGAATYLSVLHPVQGEPKKTFKIDVPQKWVDSDVELAIGEDRKLFYLHSAGYLKEYSFGLKFKPGAIKERTE